MSRAAALALVVILVSFGAANLVAEEVRELNLVTTDLIYDPTEGTLWASIPGSIGVNGNSLAPIDPVTLAVGPFTFVGSEPGKLALSDDGQYLYVGLDGAASVRRFHVPTQTPGIQFDLGIDPFFGPFYPEDLAVQPGEPNVVAVSRKNLGVSPRHGGVAVFDNGVELPNVTQRHTGSNVIEFSSSPDRLYGYNNETTEFGFRRLLVDETGVQELSTQPTAIFGFNVDIHFHQGLVYATNGVVIEPESGVLMGTYSGVSFADAVVADAALDQVFFLDDDTIDVYRLATYTFVEQIVVPGVVGSSSSLVRWGKDGLAFRTDAGQVFLVSGGLQLSVEGACPGAVTVTVTGAPPSSEVGVVAAANANGYTKGGVLCNGTVFEVGEPFQLPPGWILTDDNGTGSVGMMLSPNQCLLEAIALSTCQTSEVISAPAGGD